MLAHLGFGLQAAKRETRGDRGEGAQPTGSGRSTFTSMPPHGSGRKMQPVPLAISPARVCQKNGSEKFPNPGDRKFFYPDFSATRIGSGTYAINYPTGFFCRAFFARSPFWHQPPPAGSPPACAGLRRPGRQAEPSAGRPASTPARRTRAALFLLPPILSLPFCRQKHGRQRIQNSCHRPLAGVRSRPRSVGDRGMGTEESRPASFGFYSSVPIPLSACPALSFIMQQSSGKIVPRQTPLAEQTARGPFVRRTPKQRGGGGPGECQPPAHQRPSLLVPAPPGWETMFVCGRLCFGGAVFS